MHSGLALFAEMKPIAFGLDVDGTILADPDYFRFLSHAARARGIPVHIVTSRSRQAREETLLELRGLDIHFDAEYFLPAIDEGAAACPHEDLDWYQRYLWNKVAYALQAGLTHFYDDDDMVRNLFKRFAGGVTFLHFTPVDPKRERRP